MIIRVLNDSAQTKPPKYAPSVTLVGDINAACQNTDKPDFRKLAEYYNDLSDTKYKNTSTLKAEIFDAYTAPLRKLPPQKQEFLLCIAAAISPELTRNVLSSHRLSFCKNDFHWALRDAAHHAQPKSCQALLNFNADPNFTSTTTKQDVICLALRQYQKTDPTETISMLYENGVKPQMAHIPLISNLNPSHQLPALATVLSHADTELAEKAFIYLAGNRDDTALGIWEQHHKIEALSLYALEISFVYISEQRVPPLNAQDTALSLEKRMRSLIDIRKKERDFLKMHQSVKQQSTETDQHARTLKRMKKNIAHMFHQATHAPVKKPIMRQSKANKTAPTPKHE